MHGRNTTTPVWPIFLPKEQVRKNLSDIAQLIKKYNPDIISLQEVDRNSLSNGKLDELAELNKILKYPFITYGAHFRTPFATFGTAILSKYPLLNIESHRFPFTFPTPRKGFIVTDIELEQGIIATFVSLHTTWLDYFRPNHRNIQLRKVKEILCNRKHPIIIAGDFNDEFKSEGSSQKNDNLHQFMDDLHLHAFEPTNTKLKTYPASAPRERIDWVLVSKNFEFKTYEVVNEHLSDHLPILTNISY